MLGNIRDKRTNPISPQVDVVFEPSIHDNAWDPDGRHHFDYNETSKSPDYIYVKWLYDTTVREAVLYAETAWSIPVTVFLYNQGYCPAGCFLLCVLRMHADALLPSGCIVRKPGHVLTRWLGTYDGEFDSDRLNSLSLTNRHVGHSTTGPSPWCRARSAAAHTSN